VLLLASSLAALQAPSGSLASMPIPLTSGSPSDVSSRLLDICDVLDACERLNIQAVIAAAERELKPSGSPWGPGEHRLSGLEFGPETIFADVRCVNHHGWHHVGLLGAKGGECGQTRDR